MSELHDIAERIADVHELEALRAEVKRLRRENRALRAEHEAWIRNITMQRMFEDMRPAKFPYCIQGYDPRRQSMMGALFGCGVMP